MPAHCSESQIGVKQLSNGDYLSALDVKGNALVDQLAKEAARENRLPAQQRKAVKNVSDTVAAVATWLGQITYFANSFPDPGRTGHDQQRKLRDSQGLSSGRPTRSRTRRVATGSRAASSSGLLPGTQLHDLSSNLRWAALRQRIAAKDGAVQEAAQGSRRDDGGTSCCMRGAGNSCSSMFLTDRHLPSTVVGRQPTLAKRPRARQLCPGMVKRARMSTGGSFVNPPVEHPPAQRRKQWVSPQLDLWSRMQESEVEAVAGAHADLAELQRCGLRVSWPSCPRVQVTPANCVQLADVVPGPLSGQPAAPRQQDDLAGALSDLAELQELGFRVIWPA